MTLRYSVFILKVLAHVKHVLWPRQMEIVTVNRFFDRSKPINVLWTSEPLGYLLSTIEWMFLLS